MKIPEVRERLLQLADVHKIPELGYLATQLDRRSPTKRARSISRPMTDELRKQIKNYHNLHPRITQFEIAQVFNVNPGRVSEALKGFRT